MKKVNILIILLFSLFNISCIAQKTVQTVKKARGYNGQDISYISNTTFTALKLNNTEIKKLIKTKTIAQVINLFGEPKDTKREKDVATDGTILFERKILKYDGIIFIFPEKEGRYILSRIDLTSSSSSLKLGGHTLKVGMHEQDISASLPNIKQAKNNISIYVACANSTKKTNVDGSTDILFSDTYIKIEYNNSSQRVKKISLLMYTI